MRATIDGKMLMVLQRLGFALAFAAGAVIATTSPASAAFDPSSDELIVGTLLFALGFMLLLTLIYGVKWYFGLDRQPEIDWPEEHHEDSNHMHEQEDEEVTEDDLDSASELRARVHARP